MVLPFYLLTLSPLSAQTFTQRVQQTKQGEGTVTIHQDPVIDRLVNELQIGTPTGKAATPATPARPAQPAQPAQPKKQQTPQNPQQSQSPQSPQQTQPAPEAIDTTVVNTGRHLYKTTGYRVQVFAGGNTRSDRQKAERTGRALEQLFPGETVYVHFYSPRWICRIGNYKTYEEAHEKMMEIRKLGYASATIVKGKIIATE